VSFWVIFCNFSGAYFVLENLDESEKILPRKQNAAFKKVQKFKTFRSRTRKRPMGK